MNRPSQLSSRGAAIAVGAIVMLVLAACGPTATAIHPTVSPGVRTPTQGGDLPLGSFDDGGDGGDGTFVPSTPGTPPPPGIAQAMTGFTQGSAYEVSDVTATPSGSFVAVGFAGTGQGYFGPHNGVVWTSTDGMSWQQQVDAAMNNFDPTDVVALGNDVYVDGYFSSCPNSDVQCDDSASGNAIFKSSNGGAWQKLDQTTDILHAEFDGLGVWNDALVAWGASADDNATTTVWISHDGTTWTPTSNLAGVDPIDSLGAGGPGLVVFGTTYDENADTTALLVANSSDGVNFAKGSAPAIQDGTVTDLIAGPGGMAGIGYVENETTASLGLTMFSADGANWSQTMSGDQTLNDAQLNDVHSSASEYVMVGSAISQDDFSLQTGRVWVSADGKSWRSLGDFGGLFSQYGGSALGSAGLVVFTADERPLDENADDLATTIYGYFLPTSSLAP